MVRRWIIRSIAILICAVCVGSCIVGTVFPITANCVIGGEQHFCVEWVGSSVVAYSFYRADSEPEWTLSWPEIDSHRFESRWAVLDQKPHWAGFGGFTFYDVFSEEYYLRLHLWFLALLSVLLLLWVFRRTRRPSTVAAFPVEAKQSPSGSGQGPAER